MPRIDREAAPATMVAAAPAALALLLGRPRTAAVLGVLPVAVAAFFRDPDRTPTTPRCRSTTCSPRPTAR